ncbi:hypothetical protein LguiA_002714 [Lonicera macranthoides]
MADKTEEIEDCFILDFNPDEFLDLCDDGTSFEYAKTNYACASRFLLLHNEAWKFLGTRAPEKAISACRAVKGNSYVLIGLNPRPKVGYARYDKQNHRSLFRIKPTKLVFVFPSTDDRNEELTTRVGHWFGHGDWIDFLRQLLLQI